MSDRPRGRALRTLLLTAVVLMVMAISLWLGANELLARLPLPPAAAWGLVVLVALVPPLWLAARLIRWTAQRDPYRPTLTLGSLGLWNAGLWLALVAPGLEGGTPEEPEVVETVATVETTETPVLEPEVAPWGAERVFAERADGVVVVYTQHEPPTEGMMAELAEMMGAAVTEGHGSGFVVSDAGLVVTNHHVIDGASRATVALRSGRRAAVTVLAEDPAHDLALLQIETGEDLTVLPLAEDGASIGARAFAIGAPMGLEFSLTEGIVSAEREVSGTRMLQMQTPVAPGSSGGPLLDDAGAVVGVNTAIAGPGMNLAVHVEQVKQLIAAERTPRRLDPVVQGVRVRSLELEGAEAHPTDRMQLEQMVTYVAKGAAGCFEEPVPSGGTLTLELQEHASRVVGSDLGEAVETCVTAQLARGSQVFPWVIRMRAPEGTTALVATLDQLPGDDAERTLVLRLELR